MGESKYGFESKKGKSKISVAKEAGHYKELVIQRVNPKKPGELFNLLRLTDGQVDDFLNLIRCVGMWDPADENLPKRLDATLLQRMLDDNGGKHWDKFILGSRIKCVN